MDGLMVGSPWRSEQRMSCKCFPSPEFVCASNKRNSTHRRLNEEKGIFTFIGIGRKEDPTKKCLGMQVYMTPELYKTPRLDQNRANGLQDSRNHTALQSAMSHIFRKPAPAANSVTPGDRFYRLCSVIMKKLCQWCGKLFEKVRRLPARGRI